MGRNLADFAVLRWKGACRLPKPGGRLPGTPLDLTEYLIENKAATFMMRVDGDSMKDAGFVERARPRTKRAGLEDCGPAQRDAGERNRPLLSAGPKDAAWKLRAEYRSPRWTTRWEELPRVSAE